MLVLRVTTHGLQTVRSEATGEYFFLRGHEVAWAWYPSPLTTPLLACERRCTHMPGAP
jgi:hypothetical protein